MSEISELVDTSVAKLNLPSDHVAEYAHEYAQLFRLYGRLRDKHADEPIGAWLQRPVLSHARERLSQELRQLDEFNSGKMGRYDDLLEFMIATEFVH